MNNFPGLPKDLHRTINDAIEEAMVHVHEFAEHAASDSAFAHSEFIVHDSEGDAMSIEPIERNFETTGPVALKVEVFIGDITVTAHADQGQTSTTVRLVPRGKNGAELAEKFTVEQHGNDVVVLAPKKDGFFGFLKGSVDVEVAVPQGSSFDGKSGSGDISGRGYLGDVVVGTGSGDISVDEVADVELKSGSGDLTVRVARGTTKARTGSGDVSVEVCHGRSDLSSGSGDLQIRRAEAELRAKTGSGDIQIDASAADLELITGTGDVALKGVHGGDVSAKTGTGDVLVGVAQGVAAYLDLNTVTGDVKIDLEEADGPGDADAQTRLRITSGSGDIRVKRAQITLA